ncbi:MAG: tetratricopeptide repeat protein [Verrucomicrobiota bacterium]|jgi:hypothetical protein|nr:tetratricopeptide repeat protein [Verrucomicrobiota bacterium]
MDSDDESIDLDALKAKAEGGDLESQYEMGWRHALGMGTELDDDIAVEWLMVAADAGHMLAQNNMGARYYSGDGVEQDLKAAYRHFYLAANQGDRKAGKNLDVIAKKLSEDDLAECRRELGAS